jgi:hypothetical protein
LQKYSAVLTLAVLSCASSAFAQTTSTTMDMGGGMTHVDAMGPNGAMSSSNCMNMGGGMTSCQTMDRSQPQRTYPTPDMSHAQTSQVIVERPVAAQPSPSAPTLNPRRTYATEPAPTLGATESDGQSSLSKRPVPRQPTARTTGSASSKDRAPKFDLLCADEFVYFNKKLDKGWPLSTRSIRIDLSSERFCEGNCTQTAQLASVNDTELFLKSDKFEDGSDREIFLINRESGQFWDVINPNSDMELKFVGTCQKRTFSGFPSKKF